METENPVEGATNGAAMDEKARQKEEKKRLKREQKAAKEAAKKERARLEEEARIARELAEMVDYISINDEPEQKFGTLKLIQSKCDASGSGRKFVSLPELSKKSPSEGESVWVRARVQKSMLKGQVGFLTLRKDLETVQAVMTGKGIVKWAKRLTAESIVDVYATIRVPDGGAVAKCTISAIELAIERIYIVSRSELILPLTLEDAARPLAEDGAVEEVNESTDEKRGPTVTRDTRLNNRVIDIRVLPHYSILRVQAGVSRYFRNYLDEQGFTEIHSPKLINGSSEGGADVFKVNYFDRPCCLAQSPQLYKQMAICGDMKRVYEVGPVFRAEKSHTHRHLCEFTGLDLEMEIFEHYSEILDVLDGVFTAIFSGLEKGYARELAAIRAKWNVAPFQYYKDKPQLRLKWPEGIKLLREAGVEVGDFQDLNTEKERKLGQIVKEKYRTDFFMLTHFPSEIRPFYTMPDPVDGRYSNSYDLFMRGEEIVSGAQRIHDIDLLRERAKLKLGEEGVESIKGYVDAFAYGSYPHGGAGVGLERVVMLYLGVGNIRECSMFPRDPNRLTP